MYTHRICVGLLATMVSSTMFAMDYDEFMQNVAIGGAAGITEVSTNQWLIGLKNRAQQGQPFTLNPKVLYKGYGVGVTCMVPTTAIQVGVNKALESVIVGDDNMAKVARAFTAGAISAVAAGPTELMVIAQQNNGKNALSTIKQLYRDAGPRVFGRGFAATALRDGVWTVGYSTIYPIVFEMLKKNITSNSDDNNMGANFALKAGAGAITGVCVAAATHPADMVKTVMQADYSRKKYKNAWQAAKGIYRKHGLRGFAKGLEARASRAAIAIPVIYGVTEYLSSATPKSNNTHN